jgi:uncharacterized protein (DUF2236 family)
MREGSGAAGVLGPDSVAWRVVGHPAALVGGLRALIIQAMHPLAMAGVAQHSDYRRRPLDRLRRTSYYVTATVFGDERTARDAAARVRLLHRRVRGIDPVTGQSYSAEDPQLQLWVHCVEWHSFLAAYGAYAGRLAPDDADRYISEGVPIAALVGIPREIVPSSTTELRDYFASVQPELCVTEVAREAIDFIVNPPLTPELLPVWGAQMWLARAAVAIVPRHLRALAGIDGPAPMRALTIAASRPGLTAMRLPVLSHATRFVLGSELTQLRRSARGRRVAAQPHSSVPSAIRNTRSA